MGGSRVRHPSPFRPPWLDQPSRCQKAALRKIALQLERLPPELVEPILSCCELAYVLDLSSYAGTHLLSCIENSPTWRAWLNDTHTRLQLQDLLAACRLNPWPTPWSIRRCARYAFDRHFVLQQGYEPLLPGYPAWKSGSDIVKRLVYEIRHGTHASMDYKRHDHKAQHSLYSFIQSKDLIPLLHPSSSTLAANPHPHRLLIDSVANWSIDQINTSAALFQRAQTALHTTRLAQLRRLHALYLRHPTRLKPALAPQTPTRNPSHIASRLLRDAHLPPQPDHPPHRPWTRFAYRHACLVPYDWCLRLFVRVAADAALPAHHHHLLRTALAGLPALHPPFGTPTDRAPPQPPPRTLNTPWSPPGLRAGAGPDGAPAFVVQRADAAGWLPAAEGEVEWLEAFCACVEWMEGAFPGVAGEEVARGVGEGGQQEEREDWLEGGALDWLERPGFGSG
ncbi:uncharacterized protein K452DRAFT_292355 [Neofusicoccum parvum]|nr:uncharacterized protein K452DRAFT_292355 [Neofusicoccum parvum]